MKVDKFTVEVYDVVWIKRLLYYDIATFIIIFKGIDLNVHVPVYNMHLLLLFGIYCMSYVQCDV